MCCLHTISQWGMSCASSPPNIAGTVLTSWWGEATSLPYQGSSSACLSLYGLWCCDGLATPEQKRKRFHWRSPWQLGSVPIFTSEFAFTLVWLDHYQRNEIH